MKLKFVVIFLFSFVAYLFLSHPDEVVVKSNGNIEGVFNRFRFYLQKDRFLARQLETAKSELQYHINEPRRLAELQREIDKSQKKTDKMLAEMEREYPFLELSETEKRIEALRDEADRLEMEEFRRMLEDDRQKRMKELHEIIIFLEHKTSS